MSNDVVVDIPIEEIRAGVRAEIDSDLGGIAAQVFEKAKASTAFKDKTGRLRQSIWIYRSKYKDGGYVVYVRPRTAILWSSGMIWLWKKTVRL